MAMHNMDKNIDKQFLFDHDELASLQAEYEIIIQKQNTNNPQFANRKNRYTLYLVFLSILALFILFQTVRIYQMTAWIYQPMPLVTSQLMAQYPYLPTFIIVIRIFSVLAVLFTIIVLIMVNRLKNIDKINLRHFETTPITFDQKQDYKQIGIQQMIKLPDYLILIARKKHFRTSNGNSRYLVLRKQNDQTLYQQLVDNYRLNILKHKKMRRWVDYYLIDATDEKVK